MRRAHAFGGIGGSATDTPSLKKHGYLIEWRAVYMSEPVSAFNLDILLILCYLIVYPK